MFVHNSTFHLSFKVPFSFLPTSFPMTSPVSPPPAPVPTGHVSTYSALFRVERETAHRVLRSITALGDPWADMPWHTRAALVVLQPVFVLWSLAIAVVQVVATMLCGGRPWLYDALSGKISTPAYVWLVASIPVLFPYVIYLTEIRVSLTNGKSAHTTPVRETRELEVDAGMSVACSVDPGLDSVRDLHDGGSSDAFEW